MRLPSEVYSAIVDAAGAPPVAALQVNACLNVELAKEEETRLSHLLAEYRAPPRASDEKMDALLKKLATARDELATAMAKAENLPIGYAFFTFGNSAEKARAVDTFNSGAMRLPVGPDPKHPYKINDAPNPLDVAWRNLEASSEQRRVSNLAFTFFFICVGAFCAMIFAFFCAISSLLDAGSPFSAISDIFKGSYLRLGYFFMIVTVYAISLQSIIQPLFCVLANDGLFCNAKLRVMSCSYTALHAKCGGFWTWVEWMVASFIFLSYAWLTIGEASANEPGGEPEFLYVGRNFAENMVNWLKVPNDDINFYKMWGTECLMNLVNASLLECFLVSWVLPGVTQWLVAPTKKTQSSMDDACRLRSSAVLPFCISDCMRILAFAMWWSSLFPIDCPMLLIYYSVALFVNRTNLLGRFEPGPPTKPLLYRIIFTVYLPIHMLLRFYMSLGTYGCAPLDQVKHPMPGFFSHYVTAAGGAASNGCDLFGTAPKAFHTSFVILAILAIVIGMPWYHTRVAKAAGVLTPLQLLWCALPQWGGGKFTLDDVDFHMSTKVRDHPARDHPARDHPSGVGGHSPDRGARAPHRRGGRKVVRGGRRLPRRRGERGAAGRRRARAALGAARRGGGVAHGRAGGRPAARGDRRARLLQPAVLLLAAARRLRVRADGTRASRRDAFEAGPGQSF